MFSRTARIAFRRVSSLSGVSQTELSATRQYGQIYSSHCNQVTARSYNPNTPLNWFLGLWPVVVSPFVALFVWLNLNFWYQYKFSNEKWESDIKDIQATMLKK